ncbi:hypothetical protein [Arcobacter peruensis]|uniref:hypothetical protein n=1 Tax=Arcobacter peruensis TaxID=2320140 RepID=UPI000F0848A5|nr:hypothetical protein [Arcobacter peruensis]
MLKSIINSYCKSSNKVKLQLFILPLFFVYFYLYFYVEYNTKLIRSNEYNLESLKNKKFNKSYLKIINDLQKYLASSKIKIDFIDYKNNNLLIKGKTSILKIKDLINKLENLNNYSNISLLNISKTKNLNIYNFEINTEFKKYYLKKKQKKVSSEIKPKKVEKEIRKTNNKLELKAIVANHILINSTWYSLNDEVLDYKITEVQKNRVLLTNKDKKINLRLHHE